MSTRGLLGALLSLLLSVPLFALPCGACLPGHCDHSAAAGHGGHGGHDMAASEAPPDADTEAGHCPSMENGMESGMAGGMEDGAESEPPALISGVACCADAAEAGSALSAVLPSVSGPRAPSMVAAVANADAAEAAVLAAPRTPPPSPPLSATLPLYRLHDTWLI